MAVALRVNPGLPVQRLDREMLIFDPERDEVHLLNETATAIWEGVRDGLGSAQIEERLRRRYAVDASVDAQAMIGSVLGDLAARGILEPVPEGA